MSYPIVAYFRISDDFLIPTRESRLSLSLSFSIVWRQSAQYTPNMRHLAIWAFDPCIFTPIHFNYPSKYFFLLRFSSLSCVTLLYFYVYHSHICSFSFVFFSVSAFSVTLALFLSLFLSATLPPYLSFSYYVTCLPFSPALYLSFSLVITSSLLSSL